VQGYVADVTPPEQRAGRMGLIGAAFGLGFIFGPGLGGVLTRPDLGALGYQLPIFVAAGLCLLAALGVVVLLKESRAAADPAAPRPPFLGGVHDAMANPVVSRVLLVTLIYMAGFSGMESTFGFWTEARYGWGAREVGLAFMAVGVVSVICQGVLAGRLARRFGEARVLAVGCLIFGSGLVGQVLASRLLPEADFLVPVIMAFGAFGMAVTMPNISALISRSVDPDRQGAMLGLNMAASSLARIFGPMAAGAIFSGVGHDWPFLIGAALTVPAAVMAVNAGRAFRLRQTSAMAQAAE
jgi:MFS family permease